MPREEMAEKQRSKSKKRIQKTIRTLIKILKTKTQMTKTQMTKILKELMMEEKVIQVTKRKRKMKIKTRRK